MAALHPCSECGALTPRPRCPAHARRDPSRRAGRGGGHRWRQLVAQVVERDAGVCHLCGRPGATSADHVLPVSKGGTDGLGNLRAAHLSCNLARRDDYAAEGQSPNGEPPAATYGRPIRLA